MTPAAAVSAFSALSLTNNCQSLTKKYSRFSDELFILTHKTKHRQCWRAAHVVVRFYGEHSSMWVRPEDLTPMEVTCDSHLDRLSAMRAHPKLKHK